MDSIECASTESDESQNLSMIFSTFMNLVGQLQCKANISHANIQTLVENMAGFMEDIAEFCILKVLKFKKITFNFRCHHDISVPQSCLSEIKSFAKQWH